MQYLLTEDEYKQLLERATRGDKSPGEHELQQLCTLAAKHAPSQWGEEPWGCVLDGSNYYCDGCPVKKICPSTLKHYSK